MEKGDSFVSLHWEPPVSDGSCEVLHYIVERREVINQANIYSLTYIINFNTETIIIKIK